MRKLYLLLSLFFVVPGAYAQVCADMAVQLSATVQVSPAKITLSWKPLADTPTYTIYRKAKTAVSWGVAIAILPSTDSTYADNSVAADTAYEYKMVSAGTLNTAYGYIYAGIKIPALHNKGALVLLVDSTFTDSCAVTIQGLMKDISGDGWQIIRHDYARTMRDTLIRNQIIADHAANANVKAVLILGHIAVPYSGDLNPDGHPDHLGAWPADVYYGNLTGTWTDVSINDAAAAYPANQNIPGDGKWDQTILPNDNQLQVSRIDFANMTAFSKTEVQMMDSYLQKDHVYKMDSLAVNHRALISDNFGYFGAEAFAANGWRNFAPLVSRDSVSEIAYIASMNDSSYQWSYGCGGGSFTSAGGIGSTSDFTTNNIHGIFSMLFGSYFGDWNVQDDFMRAPLCADVPALTSCWAGRPNWFFHHMAMGENIGYSALLTQNNAALYDPSNYGAGFVHVALMGDLSLRTDYIQPARNFMVTAPLQQGATLNWTASADAGVIGYYVYRSTSEFGSYTRLNTTMITGTTYHDTSGTNGLKFYMVRPVKLEATPSGSYYNLGIGVTDSATVSYPVVNVNSVAIADEIKIFPNPVNSTLNVEITGGRNEQISLEIVNMNGQVLQTLHGNSGMGRQLISSDVSSFAPGVYAIRIRTGNAIETRKWIKAQ